MLSLIKRMFYRTPKAALTIQVSTDISSCKQCIRFLNNRYALSFITHVVEYHHLDHDVAVEVLERLNRSRSKP
jgi:hypothetical protein